MSVGKREAVATPSPLSQWGQFPIFTGVCLSYTGRPPRQCPFRGVRTRTLPCTQIHFPTRNETHVHDVASLQTPVVRFPYPLELHTPNPHPDPTVQLIELAQAGRELGGEVADGSPNDPVDLHDHLGVEVVTASCKRFDLHLEAFLRLTTQPDGAGRDAVAEKIKPLTKSGQMGFVRVESQPEIFLDTRRHGPHLTLHSNTLPDT